MEISAIFSSSEFLEITDYHKCFGGFIVQYKHKSTTLNCEMKFRIFFPPQHTSKKSPVLYFLSGLTCTDENFSTKSGAFEHASLHEIALVIPDTSPRGEDVPKAVKGQPIHWDFGHGAGFYLDATEEPFIQHYQMYSYIIKELPKLIFKCFGNSLLDEQRQSIFGHSMGGHGALICHLKNPGLYRSCSCFSPLAHPSACSVGKKAFLGYLGSVENGRFYDATLLMKDMKIEEVRQKSPVILIDQGDADQFWKDGMLLTEDFVNECKKKSVPVEFRLQSGYDHGYFFIATFIGDHIRFHANILKA